MPKSGDIFKNHIGEELANMPAQPTKETLPVTEYVTISMAEYHFLTKAATMLEIIVNDDEYDHRAVVNAVRETVAAMKRTAEAGAEG